MTTKAETDLARAIRDIVEAWDEWGDASRARGSLNMWNAKGEFLNALARARHVLDPSKPDGPPKLEKVAITKEDLLP